MALAPRLKMLRLNAGSTQTDIAQLLGVSREAYSMYESGKRQLGFDALRTLASHYHVTADYLLGRTEDSQAGEMLAEDEQALLTHYRALDARGKHAVCGLAEREYAWFADTPKANQDPSKPAPQQKKGP